MADLEVIRVIKTTLLTRGKGIQGDPLRRVTQYWAMDGTLLWEVDPVIDHLANPTPSNDHTTSSAVFPSLEASH